MKTIEMQKLKFQSKIEQKVELTSLYLLSAMMYRALLLSISLIIVGAFKSAPRASCQQTYPKTCMMANIVDPSWAPLAPVTDRLARTLDLLERDILPKGFPRGLLPSHMLAPGLAEMPMDVKETPDAYLIQMDLPGIKKEDITVDVKDRAICISAERTSMEVSKDEGESFRMMERFQGTIARSFTLPENADDDQVDAEYTDGVLRLTIKKRPEEEGIELRKKVIKIK